MGEAVKPANVGVLGDYVERQIAAEGQWAAMPVRAGLMRDILAELFDHREFRNATTHAPADLRSALEAETIEKLRDAAALVARAIGVTQMPDGTASALVFSGNDPGPQLEDILSARAAIASLEGHVS